MYWHESIPETIERAAEHPISIEKVFTPASVNHLIRRLEELEDSYDQMVVAVCYSAQLLGRPSNEIYEEAKDRSKWPDPEKQPLSCKRVY